MVFVNGKELGMAKSGKKSKTRPWTDRLYKTESALVHDLPFLVTGQAEEWFSLRRLLCSAEVQVIRYHRETKEEPMSEYQCIAFRAIDKPVSEKNLEYMRRQSSRAEITPWSFDNEYHYGDFHGDALEMLRRGYDIHLHYADFGIRKLLIRFPHGLPDNSAARPYFSKDGLRFLKDKNGQGGILCIEPFHEPGDLEDLWEIDEVIDQLVPLQAEILDGDLRPLYLAHLAIACDGEHNPSETKESPVPAGLGKLSNAQRALAELYGLSDSLISAAAQGSPPRATQDNPRNQHAEWLQGQMQSTKDAWLLQLMSDADSTVRNEILAKFRKSRHVSAWPTVRRDRTIADLEATADVLQEKANRKSAEKAARQREKKLADMAADPAPTLRETEQLVKHRSIKTYRQIAGLLADLRESLAGTDQSRLAEQQARKLAKDNPTLRMLISELRREKFLAK